MERDEQDHPARSGRRCYDRRVPVSIRPALPSDAGCVTECVLAAYEPWVLRIGRKPWPMLADYAAVIATETVLVAESEGRLCGVLVLSETSDGFLVDNVAVLPTLRGRGIGRALLIRAEEDARARGHDSIYLYTNEKMTENIALYTRVGYVAYERRQEDGFARVFMRKPLGRVGG
jgi:ribosomal protein S18 acetylase RimI-like enzyme